MSRPSWNPVTLVSGSEGLRVWKGLGPAGVQAREDSIIGTEKLDLHRVTLASQPQNLK